LTLLVIAQQATGSGAGSLIFLVLMVAVFWFLIIRPQRNRQKKQRQLAESVQVGDDVTTIGGLKGRVTRIDGDDVVLDIEQGRIRVSRRAISGRAGDAESEESESE
jgi:preprotein translocase subunit YajC